jgi:hypothetical protein
LTESSVSGDIVDVGVRSGPNINTYHVHREVLAVAPYFQNALKPEWETQRDSKPIDLSVELPRIFDLYLQYLYVRSIPDTLNSADLVHLYVLGESSCTTSLRMPLWASSSLVFLIEMSTPQL